MRTIDPARHRARRQHILHAAAPLFASRGFDATTTAEICRAAGMSSGNLFHYFASKRDVFVALLTHDADQTAALRGAIEAGNDPWDALVSLIDQLARPACEPLVPGLVLQAMLQAGRDPELAELLDLDAQQEADTIAALIRRAADAGQIAVPSDAEQIATWITTLIGGVYLAAATTPDHDTAAQIDLLHLTVDRLLHGP